MRRVTVHTAATLDPLLGRGASTFWEPPFVLLDVDHAANDAREVLWVVKGHERIECAEGVPLSRSCQQQLTADHAKRWSTYVAVKRVVVGLIRLPVRILPGVCAVRRSIRMTAES